MRKLARSIIDTQPFVMISERVIVIYNLEELLYLRIVEKSTMLSSCTISCLPVTANGSLRSEKFLVYFMSFQWLDRTLSLLLTTFNIDIITCIVFLLSSRCSETPVVLPGCLICLHFIWRRRMWAQAFCGKFKPNSTYITIFMASWTPISSLVPAKILSIFC